MSMNKLNICLTIGIVIVIGLLVLEACKEETSTVSEEEAAARLEVAELEHYEAITEETTGETYVELITEEELFYEEEETEIYEEVCEVYTDTYEDGWNYFSCSPQWNSTYMGVHCITDTGSEQYHWLSSHEWGYTDDGICSYDGRILVALTPTFGEIGDYVDLLFDDGSILYCIIGDHKANSDVYGHWSDGYCNVLELIVSPDWYTGHENIRYGEVIAWQ